MTTKVCPRCKSKLIKSIDESEVFGVSKKRMHVYTAQRKGIKCLTCNFSSVRFGIK